MPSKNNKKEYNMKNRYIINDKKLGQIKWDLAEDLRERHEEFKKRARQK